MLVVGEIGLVGGIAILDADEVVGRCNKFDFAVVYFAGVECVLLDDFARQWAGEKAEPFVYFLVAGNAVAGRGIGVAGSG